jgi:uncharacterized protein YegL
MNEDVLNDFNFDEWDNSNIKTSRKVPMCLLVDTSGSMSNKDGSTKPKIDELNNNMKGLIDYIRNDSKASRICDLSIISFGGSVNVVSGYSSIDSVQFSPLSANGNTPMGEAVSKAIEMLKIRRNYYRNNGIEHYKPILLIMSDGNPTDDYKPAAYELTQMVQNKELKVFPVGIGQHFDHSILSEFSPQIAPKLISDASGFSMLFKLLSSSSSNPNDDSLERWFNDEF